MAQVAYRLYIPVGHVNPFARGARIVENSRYFFAMIRWIIAFIMCTC